MTRIFLVEDNTAVREGVRRTLEESGHEVVAEAVTLQDALNFVDQLKEGVVDVAILDGSLFPGSQEDGRRVAKALRDQIPESSIKIIVFSARDQSWGDVYVPKSSGPAELLKII